MSISSRFPKLAAAILLALAVAGRAETLEQITAEALRESPQLRLLEQDLAAARGGVTSARTFANPELSIAPGVKQVRESGRRNTEFHIEAGFSQLFKFPGKRALEIAIAGREVRSTEIALEALRCQLASLARRDFYELLAAEKILETRSQQVASAKEFAASARQRVESGFAGDFETVKSEAELISARKAEREAKGRVAAARVTLNLLLGRSASASPQISGNLENTAPRGSSVDFTALARARNPALRAQIIAAEKAGLSLRLTRFGKRPDFALGPSLEYTDTEQIYGLSATIALPFWDQKKGEIETATAGQRKALAELEKLRLEIEGTVAKAAGELQIAKDQLALYSPEFLDHLRNFMRQAEQGYAQSATTLIIYLDAKRTYYDTLSDYYETVGKVAQSRAELESAVGVPLDIKP
jgi:cobalt-zinc-cadmium efflux system outer membrane protein